MGTPFVILASGQDNLWFNRSYGWTPDARVKVWNQTKGSDESVGNGWSAVSNSQINFAYAYASLVAAADPNKDVYVINLSRLKMDIGHWVPGILYKWETTVGGAPAAGHVRRNNAAPDPINQFNVSEVDVYGSPSFAHIDSALPGVYVQVDAVGARLFASAGVPVDKGTWHAMPVTYQSGTGYATAEGNINITVSPNFNKAARAVVPAALASLGVSHIDMVLWWQGESDALEKALMSKFKQEWEFFFGNLHSTASWIQAATKVVLMGLVSDAKAGTTGTFDKVNTALQQLVATDPANRVYVDTQSLALANWTSMYQMTAAGYKNAADLAFATYAPALLGPVVTPPSAPGTIRIRNAADTAWIDEADLTGLYVRNAANTGWIDIKGKSRKIRKADNSGWYGDADTGGGGGGGTGITAVEATAGWTTVMDFSGNPLHALDPHAGGLYADGPFNPYVGGDGNTYALVTAGYNYRFRIPTLLNGATWVLDGPVFSSAQDHTEVNYNDTVWLLAKWAQGNTVYSAAHMEFYYGGNLAIPNMSADAWGVWWASPKWMRSLNNGASWAQWGGSGSSRVILVPEPSYTPPHNQRLNFSGWAQPSNIVKEGAYYYCTFATVSYPLGSWPLSGPPHMETGVVMVRTTDLSTPLGWQFWNGSGWTTINHLTWQGSSSPSADQRPYLFFKVVDVNPYVGSGAYSAYRSKADMNQCLRLHGPSNTWMMFGTSRAAPGGGPAYATSPTLANPQWEASGIKAMTLTGALGVGDYLGFHYCSVIDPTYDNSDNQNFMKIGNNPQWWTVGTPLQATFRYHPMKITAF